jgi:predicted secreted protein
MRKMRKTRKTRLQKRIRSCKKLRSWRMRISTAMETSSRDEGEYEMPSAELGQEGVSVWDLLSESFLKEAS